MRETDTREYKKTKWSKKEREKERESEFKKKERK